MLIAAAVCPHPPLLIPEATGLPGVGDPQLERLRTACHQAISALLAGRPDLIAVVGGDPETRQTAEYPPQTPGRLHDYGIPFTIGAGQGLVVGHVRGAGHRPDVEQMVRDTLPGGFALLGGTDVHTLVELHRVGVHDLAAQGAGQRDGQPGLAGGGRPDDGDDVRTHGYQCARRQLATT